MENQEQNLNIESPDSSLKNYFKNPKIILLIYIFGLFLLLFIFFISFTRTPENFPVNEIISIEKGDNLKEISLKLKEKNFIKSDFIFEIFVIFYGGEKKIIPGNYFFENPTSASDIAKTILIRDKRFSDIKVTIREGLNNEEIASLLSKKLTSFNKDKFLILVKDKQGYLFPDTYFFPISYREDEVIDVLLKNFERKVLPLFLNSVLSKYDQDLFLKDTLIFASILEKEAKGDNDRELISGILRRRLSIGMPLQVDAVTETYDKKGLPERPIANPGIKAIQAILHPKSSNFLYYLHSKDGQVYFAKTYKEHLSNINNYLR